MPPLEPLLLLTAALCLGTGYVVLVHRAPLVGVVTLVSVVAFVPIWVGANVMFFFPAASVITIATAVGLRPAGPLRWSAEDLVMGFLVVAALAPLAVGRLSLASAFGVATVWVAGYLAGRFALVRVDPGELYAVVAVVFGIVGVLAVVEFLLDWHALSSWGPWNSSRRVWGGLQGRGGYVRAEGAFGHSIALGASLAMAAALTYGARLPVAWRVTALVAITAGAAVSLSRLGLITAVLGLALCVVLIGSPALRSMRRATLVVLGIGGALVLPWVTTVLDRAGQEAAGSANYRRDLIALLPEVDLLGASPTMRRSASGVLYFDGFRSIDSQLLLFGLSYGWLVLLAVLALVGFVAFRLVAERKDPAAAAVVAQLPALATVALITQYAVFFWFVLGLAVSAHARGLPTRGNAGWPGVRSPAAVEPRSSGAA